MARSFVADVLLPLVEGGTLAVGRPLSLREVRTLMRTHTDRPSAAERDAAEYLERARRKSLEPLVPVAPELPLDETTWRLGAAVHNLLALGHPRIATGPGAETRLLRVAASAVELASVGAPASLAATLARHSLLARLGDIQRSDHTVRYWLGARTFVGRTPPARILALPRVRGVRVQTVRRSWLRDVGIVAVARPAFAALTEASPLGEALDPLRLDPPVSWGRLLSVLRFPAIARLVAGRVVELGVGVAGDALAEALYRFGSMQDGAGPIPASTEAVAFALAFLAHVVWLDHVFDSPGGLDGMDGRAGRAGFAGRASRSNRRSGPVVVPDSGRVRVTSPDGAGRELAVVLAAAGQVQPDLIWPPDVERASPLGGGFARALARTFDRHQVSKSPRWAAALELGGLGVQNPERVPNLPR